MSMFGSLGEMANLMKNFGQIQNNMKKMQQELASVEVRGTSYSNIAEVVMSGDMIVKSVKLDPAALAVQNRELVENAVKEGRKPVFTPDAESRWQERLTEREKEINERFRAANLISEEQCRQKTAKR